MMVILEKRGLQMSMLASGPSSQGRGCRAGGMVALCVMMGFWTGWLDGTVLSRNESLRQKPGWVWSRRMWSVHRTA